MSAGSLRRRVLGAALAVAAALGIALPVAGPAVAATADPDLPVSVQISEVSPSILRPGQDLRVRATLHNDGDEALEEPTAALRISRFRISSRAEVDAWASAGSTGLNRTSRVATTPVAGPLLPGASVTVELVVPAADVRLLDGADTWGPRGLVVEALDGSERVGLQRTFLLWLTTDDVPQTRLSLLVPVVGLLPDPVDSEAQSAALDDLTAPGGRLSDVSAAIATSSEIGVAADPALLAAATESPGSHTWATELTDTLARRDTAALPWSDPDIAAAAHADHADLVQLAVDRTAQAGIPGRSVTSDLLWAPGTELPDQPTAAVTARVGATTLVLPPVADDAGAGDDTPGAAATVQTPSGAVDALAPDATLTRLFSEPTRVEPGATTSTTVQRALAELAVITRETESDQPHLLIAPGRAWQPDVTTVSALTAAFSHAPWVRVSPVSELLDAPSPDNRVTLPSRATSADELAPADVRALADARTRAVAFAGVTSEPATLLAGVDTDVLAPLAVAWRADPERRAALVASVVADIDTRTTGLSIAPISDVRVVAADSALPVIVRNELAVPATVLLDVTPRTACLEVGTVEPVVLEAQSEKSVRIPLHARANCTVVVSAQLTAPNGLAVSPTVQFTAQVAPTIEGVGTIVIGALLAVGLVLGIVRTVRRGQSARRGARIAAEADAPISLPVLGGTPDDDATGQDPR